MILENDYLTLITTTKIMNYQKEDRKFVDWILLDDFWNCYLNIRH